MKKLLSLITLSGLIFLVSCGEKAKKAETVSPESKYAACFKGAPDWVLNESIEGAKLAAVGSAKIGKAGLQFAIEEAESAARDKLARMIEVRVKNMTKRFMQSIGVGDQETVDRVSVQVSKQVSYATLRGARAVRKWISPCDEVFVLVAVDPEVAKEMVKQNILSSFKNERALWQQFQAKKGFEELEKEVEKEFKGQP